MKATAGIPKKQRLQYHVLRRCSKYKDMLEVTRRQEGPPPQQRPASPSPVPQVTARPSTASQRPKPVKCKKAKGD